MYHKKEKCQKGAKLVCPPSLIFVIHVLTQLQDKVLNILCDAYHDQTGYFNIPESLRMKKDMSNHREASELKSYRTKNRYYSARQGHDNLMFISQN